MIGGPDLSNIAEGGSLGVTCTSSGLEVAEQVFEEFPSFGLYGEATACAVALADYAGRPDSQSR